MCLPNQGITQGVCHIRAVIFPDISLLFSLISTQFSLIEYMFCENTTLRLSNVRLFKQALAYRSTVSVLWFHHEKLIVTISLRAEFAFVLVFHYIRKSIFSWLSLALVELPDFSDIF